MKQHTCTRIDRLRDEGKVRIRASPDSTRLRTQGVSELCRLTSNIRLRSKPLAPTVSSHD